MHIIYAVLPTYVNARIGSPALHPSCCWTLVQNSGHYRPNCSQVRRLHFTNDTSQKWPLLDGLTRHVH
ncbi:Protein-arginine deiminase type-4 [Fusarium oxysporum f. sp. albedinis]|nr:Protein-arginine deiminase type-4 [Fusarium oxysporum f. sp. albedinis]